VDRLEHLLKRSVAARFSPFGEEHIAGVDEVLIRLERLAVLEGRTGTSLIEAETGCAGRKGGSPPRAASTQLARALAEDVLRACGVDRPEVDVVRSGSGAPLAVLSDRTRADALRRAIAGVALSMSYANAHVAGIALPLMADVPSAGRGASSPAHRVLGVGIDIVPVRDVEDVPGYPEGAVERLFSAQELRGVDGLELRDVVIRFARMLAAKEAAFKALGHLQRDGVQLECVEAFPDVNSDFRDIDIAAVDTLSPRGVLRGGLAAAVRQSCPDAIELPLATTYCDGAAAAVALCITRPRS
jgi:phosphopantetheine--protein transferase-like protein